MARSRLDRFLARDGGSGWLDRVIQQAKYKFTSDHLHIVLRSRGMSSGLRSFKFLNAWVEDQELHKMVKDEWERSEMGVGGFCGRLKAIREAVRNWHGEHFSFFEKRFKDCEFTLPNLLLGQVPSGEDELTVFQVKKKWDLMVD